MEAGDSSGTIEAGDDAFSDQVSILDFRCCEFFPDVVFACRVVLYHIMFFLVLP